MSSRAFQAIPLLGLLLLAPLDASARGAPDPQATALIQQLELKAAPVAARDLPGWKVPTRVVVATGDAARLAALRELLPGVEILAAAQDDALDAQLATAEVAIGLCDAQTLAAGKRLHWIQALQVGVERCLAVPGFARSGIVLTNMQRTSGPQIAEHAMAMVLALTRGLPHYGRNQQAGRWSEAAPATPLREVGGRTLLVVGLGGIGTEVARRAHGLGMRVIATRNSSREGPGYVARVGLPDELLALAAEADVVVNAVPLTPATTGIFDAKFFAALKPEAYFVNVARGGSVVTADLVEALASGRLAGAGLDVTEPEPLPAGHALWAMPNVIITPHVAAGSTAQAERSWILVRENLRRYAAGEPLLNVVDVARGY
jgi:phosphoglycerate dehydrogenase-like enzyme